MRLIYNRSVVIASAVTVSVDINYGDSTYNSLNNMNRV